MPNPSLQMPSLRPQMPRPQASQTAAAPTGVQQAKPAPAVMPPVLNKQSAHLARLGVVATAPGMPGMGGKSAQPAIAAPADQGQSQPAVAEHLADISAHELDGPDDDAQAEGFEDAVDQALAEQSKAGVGLVGVTPSAEDPALSFVQNSAAVADSGEANASHPDPAAHQVARPALGMPTQIRAPRPGVFTRPVAPAPAPAQAEGVAEQAQASPAPAIKLPESLVRASQSIQQTGVEGFFAQNAADQAGHHRARDGVAMRTLTRLLESVYQRPGSRAALQERIATLQSLVEDAGAIGRELSQAFGHRVEEASPFVVAQAMESAVAMVSRSWEDGGERDVESWIEMIRQAGADPLIMDAAERMTNAVYQPVQSNNRSVAHERLALSAHTAYWDIYTLGKQVNGISTEVARDAAMSIAGYAASMVPLEDLDSRTIWLQGSIKRITSLFCAQLRSMPIGTEIDKSDVEMALNLAKEGFHGIEKNAAMLLEGGFFDVDRKQPVDQHTPVG